MQVEEEAVAGSESCPHLRGVVFVSISTDGTGLG